LNSSASEAGHTVDALGSRLKAIPSRVSGAVVRREYRPLAHTVSIIIIIAASCLLFYQSFFQSGVLMHVDMTWATSLGRINEVYRHTWLQFGSSFGLFYLMAILWEYPLLLVCQVLHVSTSTYLLLLFVSTLSLAGVSMYALTYKTIRSLSLSNTWKYAAFAGGVLAAFVYMFNPWSLGHLWPYYMYPAYALMPLIVMVIVKAFKSPSLKYIIVLAILLSFATNAPINIVWLWFLLLSYAIYFLVTHRFGKASILSTLKVVGGSFVLYFFVNATWIFPYLGIRLWTTASAGPQLAQSPVNQSMLNGLSMNNNILNNLRLTSAWHTPVETSPNNTLALFLTLSIPLLAFIGLFLLRKRLKKNGTVVFLGLLSLVAIVLATGTSSFFKPVYDFLVFDFFGSSLGWLIRVPDRWLVFVPMIYCIAIGSLCAFLLRKKTASSKTGLLAGGGGKAKV